MRLIGRMIQQPPNRPGTQLHTKGVGLQPFSAQQPLATQPSVHSAGQMQGGSMSVLGGLMSSIEQQVPLQHLSPTGQVLPPQWQVPPEQVPPAPQAVPHLPQFSPSLLRFLQPTVPQQLVPPPQAAPDGKQAKLPQPGTVETISLSTRSSALSRCDGSGAG